MKKVTCKELRVNLRYTKISKVDHEHIREDDDNFAHITSGLISVFTIN